MQAQSGLAKNTS